MNVLLNAAGTPEPSPELQRRLRGVHPGLGLRFNRGTENAWMITMEWDRADVRWEMVKRQELGAGSAFDIVGYLPMACSLDEAPAYIAQRLRTYPREDVKRMADRVAQYNATTPMKAAVEEAIEGAMAEATTTKRKKGNRTKHAIPSSEE